MAANFHELYNGSIGATSAGGWKPLTTATMVSVTIAFTGGSGTPGSLDVWIEETHDGGITYAPVVAPTRVNPDKTVGTNIVKLVAAKNNLTVETYQATFPWFPGRLVRAAWAVTGGTNPLWATKIMLGYK